MNISVFGLGYVGCVSLGCLAQNGHRVIGVDTNVDKVKQVNAGKATIIERDIDDIVKSQRERGSISATTDFEEAVLQTEVSMIAVGTPSSASGHLDLSFMKKVCEQIGEALKEKQTFHIVLIRSTVPPGTNKAMSEIIEKKSGRKTGEGFAVASNPEFLREGTAVNDYYHPPFTVIGTRSPKVADTIREMYAGVEARYIVTEPEVAEMIKFVSNSFHALKVTFANEVGNICKSLGVDSHKVMEIFAEDTHLNISPYYLKPGFAYGGSCLPKDLAGLKAFAHDNYLDSPVVESISRSNEVQVKRAVDAIASFKRKSVGVIGLSFKAGTDDLRNSPTVAVIETLLGKGFNVKVYDRDVYLTKLTGTNWKYIQEHLPHLSALLVHDPQEVISSCEVIVIATNETVLKTMDLDFAGKSIVDLSGGARHVCAALHYNGLSW